MVRELVHWRPVKELDKGRAMKPRLSVFLILIIFCLSLAPAIDAQATYTLKVAEGTICKDVVGRKPIEAGKKFEPTVGKLYCFTTIAGAERGAQITHVWFYGDVERARVNLSVESENWRTYSSKRIQAHETGTWRVEILGPDGNVLKTLEFEIGP